nr:hypothetical protein CFP56_06858 [Quercus suber]
MFGDSEVMSKHTPLIRKGSDDDLSRQATSWFMIGNRHQTPPKNWQDEIKKAVALRVQGGGLSAQPPHVSKKRKHTSDAQSSGKGANGSSIHPEACKVAIDAPRHGIGKGLMTSQGLVVPPPFPFLVKEKKYVTDTARSIIRDVDLDKCLKHKTDPLGDSSLHDIMMVIDLKAKLSGMTHQTKDLVKENANLKFEVVALHEHMEQVREEAIEEYQVSQPYFNEMGVYYGNEFEDFHKQAILMFLDLDFSQIQIKLTTPTTTAVKPILNDVETNKKVMVIDRPLLLG